MKAVIDFFVSIAKSFGSALVWLVGVPSVLFSAIFGLIQSVRSVVDSIFSPISNFDGVLNDFASLYGVFSEWASNLPSIAKVAIYSLSLDTLLSDIVSVLILAVTTTFFVLSFVLVTLPTYLVSLVTIKYTAKVLVAFIPSSYVPSFLVEVSNISLPFAHISMVFADRFLGRSSSNA